MDGHGADAQHEEEVDYDFEDQDEDAAEGGDDGDLAPEDLYGDLYTEEGITDQLQSLSVHELQQKAAMLIKTAEQLQERLDRVSAERDELRAERAILVRNMSCIFKTAQLELQRKDNQLRELRQPRPWPP